MVQRVEKLAGMSSIMADGGECASHGTMRRIIADEGALGQVLKNWPHVFSVLNLFGELV